MNYLAAPSSPVGALETTAQITSPGWGLLFGMEMPYLVQGRLDDITLTATTETAKDAFAKAIEWHVAERFADVTVSHGSNIYSIDEFALVIARLEIEVPAGRKRDDAS